MQQLRMQQVQTERDRAQDGKAYARKAGPRLAALALALAMVFTTTLPAFAEGDLGELVDGSGTSTDETVPGTDPTNEPTPQEPTPQEPTPQEPAPQEPAPAGGTGGEGTTGGTPYTGGLGEAMPTGNGFDEIDGEPGLSPLADDNAYFTVALTPAPDGSHPNPVPDAWNEGTVLRYQVVLTNDGSALLSSDAGQDESHLDIKIVNDSPSDAPKDAKFDSSTAVIVSDPGTMNKPTFSNGDKTLRIYNKVVGADQIICPSGATVTFWVLITLSEQNRTDKDFKFTITVAGTKVKNYDSKAAQTFTRSYKEDLSNSYTLTYHGNEAEKSVTVAESEVSVTLLTEAEARDAGLVPRDSTLTNWSTVSASAGTQYVPGAVVEKNLLFTDPASKTADLYAVTASRPPTKTVTLTYDANGGTGVTHPVSEPLYEGETQASFTLLDAAAVGFTAPIGKVFAGWHISSAATADAHDLLPAGETYTIAENATLYAIWKDAPAGKYTIVYHYVDPAVSDAKDPTLTTTVTGDDPTFTLLKPTDVNMGTPELGSTLNGRQIVGWHTVVSSKDLNMTVGWDGKLSKETYDASGKAQHSSEFAKLTAFEPKNHSYGACGEKIELLQEGQIDLYPVLGPAFGYTLTIAEGDFPSTPDPDNEHLAKDKRFALTDGENTVLMANGFTSAANARKYVLFDRSFEKKDEVTVTTAIPVDDRTTADQYHFVAWFDKRARDNKEKANIFVLPGETAIFGQTANVYSLDAIWFDMQAEDARFTYDGTTQHSVGLSEPVLIGTSDYDAEKEKEVEIDRNSYSYTVKYWKDPNADTSTTPNKTYDIVKNKTFDELPKFADAGTYLYDISVNVGIKVDGKENSYCGKEVQTDTNGRRYILETFTVHAKLIIDPVDLYISHTSTRYRVNTEDVPVNFKRDTGAPVPDSGTTAPVEVAGLLGGDTLTNYSATVTGNAVGLFQLKDTPGAVETAAKTVTIIHTSGTYPDGTERPLGTKAEHNYRIHQDVQLRILQADIVSIKVPFAKTLKVADPAPYQGAVLPAGSYHFAFTADADPTTAGSDSAFADVMSAVLNVESGKETDSVTSTKDALYATFYFTQAPTPIPCARRTGPACPPTSRTTPPPGTRWNLR